MEISGDVDVEFVCPHCGSSWFRTNGDARFMKTCTGECKGCGYEWPRTDDWKVFAKVLREHFPTKADYDGFCAP